MVKQNTRKMKPITRDQCPTGSCHWVNCRHNMAEGSKTKGDLGDQDCVLRIIDKQGDMMLREVGKALNISRERVRQIEEKALGKVKEQYRVENLYKARLEEATALESATDAEIRIYFDNKEYEVLYNRCYALISDIGNYRDDIYKLDAVYVSALNRLDIKGDILKANLDTLIDSPDLGRLDTLSKLQKSRQDVNQEHLRKSLKSLKRTLNKSIKTLYSLPVTPPKSRKRVKQNNDTE